MLSMDLINRFDSREFREFLDADPQINLDQPYFMIQQDRSLRYADATVAAVYHRMADLLGSCPVLHGVRPDVRPTLDGRSSPSAVILEVRFKLAWTERPDSWPALELTYAHGESPPSFGEAEQLKLMGLMETCERLDLGAWDHLRTLRLFKRATPYESQAEIVADMEADVGGFLAQVRQWALEQNLPAPDGSARPAFRM